MKAFSILLMFLVAGNIFAANTKNSKIFIEQIGQDLVVTTISEQRLPALNSEVVDVVIEEKLGNLCYNQSFFFPKLRNGPLGRVFETSATYRDFFNSPLIMDSKWNYEQWASKIRERFKIWLTEDGSANS